MLAAIVAMVAMIVIVDQVFWRPIVVWSEKYKLEEQAEADKPQSWMLNLLQHSRLYERIARRLRARRQKRAAGVSRGHSGMATAPIPARGPAAAAHGGTGGPWTVARSVGRWVVLGLLAVAAVWGAWTLLRLLIGLPLRDARSGDDWLHVLAALAVSFLRTSAAVLLGAAWALPVGILIGLSPKWSQRLQPVIQVVASFPAPMLFPLVTLLLVLLRVPFTAGCVALMLLGAQWYILFNVIAGATAIPADLKEVSAVYRMSRRERWMRLYVPCVFPYLATGLVTAAGGAWNATIVSEYVQVKDRNYTAFGLGSTISRATAAGNFPLLCAAVVTMAVFVVLVNRFFWKRLYRLAEGRYSLNA
jgi:NitT/TauT family transport system permease protein